ncbi:pirin, N-terminal:Pirin, C-terminal [Tepidicaulis marinus]|uniref:Pirin, N-terminal:Pirin, C-terminal n=1 Tax=Tepidicaulis marinus TaxID=1333998 RepID=A0A081B734_9HYPH|nr:pirin family protein [Tepidicaulis marinus]GAK43852.1 pirin, N-terminal:Pirin, C-terminal [Tepidicaulis marinus]
MKKLLAIHSAPPPHWVGDGFPVRSLFSYQHERAADFSPFLLFDYAGPATFEPAARPRGVGTHPHRGFETVTLVYQGEVSHRDSTGKGGTIGPGDVQWMTAGGGILHEEFHSEAFTASGGTFQVVQLWVNLPAEHKMTAPGYQAIAKADIPEVALADSAGSVRVIAGEYAGAKGPAKSFTPMHVWDLRLGAGGKTALDLPEGWTALLAVLEGKVDVNGAPAGPAEIAELARAGREVEITAREDAKLLLLSGAPIDEPIAAYGPFVMNDKAEIRQAIADFNEGRFGRMPA